MAGQQQVYCECLLLIIPWEWREGWLRPGYTACDTIINCQEQATFGGSFINMNGQSSISKWETGLSASGLLLPPRQKVMSYGYP